MLVFPNEEILVREEVDIKLRKLREAFLYAIKSWPEVEDSAFTEAVEEFDLLLNLSKIEKGIEKLRLFLAVVK